MLERLKSAIPLIILVVLAFTLPGMWGAIFFYLLAAGMLTFGVSEAFSMTSFKDSCRPDFIITLIFTFALTLLPVKFGQSPIAEPLVIILYLLALAALLCKRGPEHTHKFFTSIGIFFYVAWTMSFFPKIFFLDNGPRLLLYATAVTKMCDVGAYFLGSVTAKRPQGNHKLAPALSPKKSWEGLAGGILFGALTALFCTKFACIGALFTWWEALLFGTAAAVIGLVGDLIESAMKRIAGLKDSGHLPGIGGILDVLDSIIPIAPLFYIWLIFKLA